MLLLAIVKHNALQSTIKVDITKTKMQCQSIMQLLCHPNRQHLMVGY